MKCRLCGIELSFGGGSTGSMNNHIRLKHPTPTTKLNCRKKSIWAVNNNTHKALLSRVLGLFANLAIHRDWLDDKYFVGGGAGLTRAVNDVG